MTTWLTPEEVAELTSKKRWPAQCRALATMGVPFRPNAVGRPLVERVLVCSKPQIARRRVEPDWSALHGQAA
jgi:hypothetical protein